MKWWKALGVAAFVGVAATGVAIARAERERRAYTPEQIRERLHARSAEIREVQDTGPAMTSEPAGRAGALAARWRVLRGRTLAARPMATIGRVLRGIRRRPVGAGSTEEGRSGRGLRRA